MSEKMFICKKGWKRHPKGHIINEWEWKRLAIETRREYFEEYISPAVLGSPGTSSPTDFKKHYYEPEEIKQEPEITEQDVSTRKKFNYESRNDLNTQD